MQVTKDFRFYAAHRNEEIGGKCGNIHGHRYGLRVTVEQKLRGSVTILFEDLEGIVNEVVIDRMDHSMLLDRNDSAYDQITACDAFGKLYITDYPTSAENMAAHIISLLRGRGLNVIELELKETDTSSVTVR